MKAGPDSAKSMRNKVTMITSWMDKVQNKCRVLIFVDTHANSSSGNLQITGTTGGKPPKTVSIDIVSRPINA